MKKIKTIIRLLIFIPIISYFMSLILNPNSLNNGIDIYLYLFNGEYWGELGADFYVLSGVFQPLIEFFTDKLGFVYLPSIVIGILSYQIYCSLAFIFFDFLSMPLSWGKKLIKKGTSDEN